MQYRKKPARHPWQVLLSDRRCVGINKAPSLLIINILQPSFRTKVHYKKSSIVPYAITFLPPGSFEEQRCSDENDNEDADLFNVSSI